MSTVIDYKAVQETERGHKAIQSLLLMVRNFMSHEDTSIQGKHVWDSERSKANIPPRVWRRHSALLTLLVHQPLAVSGKIEHK